MPRKKIDNVSRVEVISTDVPGMQNVKRIVCSLSEEEENILGYLTLFLQDKAKVHIDRFGDPFIELDAIDFEKLCTNKETFFAKVKGLFRLTFSIFWKSGFVECSEYSFVTTVFNILGTSKLLIVINRICVPYLFHRFGILPET